MFIVMMVKIFCHLHIFLLRLFQAFYYYKNQFSIIATTQQEERCGFAVLPLRSALCNAILDKMDLKEYAQQ